MHLLQIGIVGLPTLLEVRVAIVKGGQCACECGAGVLLRRGLATNVRVGGDVGVKKMREAGEILNLPEGEEFSCLLLYKRDNNTACCHAGQAHATRMLPPREVNPPLVKLLNFKAT